MFPMLEDLVRELEHSKPYQSGVRALFLYPLNALIESQKDRLEKFTKGLGGAIRFALYNSELPENVKNASRTSPAVPDRRTMRERPPQIMVSNPSMIERMVLREKDRPIIEATRKARCFRWIVIDEAHTYSGSKAAELALLIRRFLNAIDCNPQDVHFVCTSATMNAAQEKNIIRFLSDLSSVPESNVLFLRGERKLPPCVQPDLTQKGPEPTLEELSRIESDTELKAALRRSSIGMAIRNAFIEGAQKGQPWYALSKLRNKLHADGHGDLDEITVLKWIDILSKPLDVQFLPLRIHQMLNALGRIMVCANPECPEKTHPALHDPRWRFGSIWLDERTQCPCGAPLFPLAACSECNAVYLKACVFEDGWDTKIEPPRSLEEERMLWDTAAQLGASDVSSNLDEDAALDTAGTADIADIEPIVDPTEADSAQSTEGGASRDEADEALEGMSPEGSFPRRPALITNNSDAEGREGLVSYSGPLEDDPRNFSVRFIEADSFEDEDESAITCTDCGAALKPRYYYVRSISDRWARALMPFILEHCAGDHPKDRPMDGARLLTFTDSRLQTSERSALIEREGERSLAVTMLMDLLMNLQANSNPESIAAELKRRKQQIVGLEASRDPLYKDVIEKLKEEVRELEASESTASVSWEELKNAVVKNVTASNSSEKLSRMLRNNVLTQTKDEDGRLTAEVLLLREFGFRPRNGVSLETCGLVRINYPLLKKIHHSPSSSWPAEFGIDGWRNYLKIILDYEIRANFCYKVPDGWKYFCGDKRIRPKVILHYSADDPTMTERTWPSLDPKALREHRKIRRIVEFTAALLGIELCDNTSESDIARVNDVLHAACNALVRGDDNNPDTAVLSKVAGRGFVLDLERTAEFSLNASAWQFQRSKQLYDTIIGAPENAVCPGDPRERGAVSTELPKPFTDHIVLQGRRDDARRALREHLERQPAYRKLIAGGFWNRVGTYALEKVGYFSAAEHSAQIARSSRRASTEGFKEGYINVLSSSTTMEMGVDIGGINSVLLNGVPPHSANYLQRAGRAGRSSETRANVLTICRNSARDRQVFKEPTWPLTAPQPSLTVSLESQAIVQRHVNASLFADYILENKLEAERLGVEDWIKKHHERFMKWLCSLQDKDDAFKHLRSVIRRSVLANARLERLRDDSRMQLQQLADKWSRDILAYRTKINALQSQGSEGAACTSLNLQLLLLSKKDIFDKLVEDLWLPSSIRVTNVTSFNTFRESEEKEYVDNLTNKAHSEQEKSSPRQKLADRIVTRENHVGIFEYAPDATLIIDGSTYRSAGIDFRGGTVHDPKAAGTVQERGWVLRCGACDHVSLLSLADPLRCPACGTSDNLTKIESVLPTGFKITDKPTKNLNDKVRYQRTPDLLSIDEPWSPLGMTEDILVRSSESGQRISLNRGKEVEGFDVCLGCGYARPADPDDDEFRHYPIRTTNAFTDAAGYCSGSADNNSYLRLKGVALAAVSRTDCFAISFKVDSTLAAEWNERDKASPGLHHRSFLSAGVGIAVMLRRVIAEYFAIEEDEIAFTDPIYSSQSGRLEISFYDLHNGGYCTRTVPALPELLRKALRKLSECRCDSACIDCVLSFDTNRFKFPINRHDGYQILNSNLMSVLSIPAALSDVLGDNAQYLIGTLEDVLIVLASQRDKAAASFYVKRPADDLNLPASDLFTLIRSLHITAPNIRLHLVACGFKWTELTPENQTWLSEFAELGVAFNAVSHAAPTHQVEVWDEAQPADEASRLLLAVQGEDGIFTFPDLWNWEEAGCRMILGRKAKTEVENAEAPKFLEPVREASPADSAVVSNFDPTGLCVVDFGTRFLEACAKALGQPHLEDWYRGAEVKRVLYSDRYIARVLDPLLVLSIFKGIAKEGNIASDAEFIMQTNEVDSDYARDPSQYPYKLRFFWRSNEQRKEIIDAVIEADASLNQLASLKVLPKANVPHDRRLSIELSDGRTLWMMIGRGVSVFMPADMPFLPHYMNNKHDMAARLLEILNTKQSNRDELTFAPEEAVFSVWETTN